MWLNRSRATAVLADHGLDAVVATLPEDVAYLSMGDFPSLRSKHGLRAYGVLTGDEARTPSIVIPAQEVDPWAELPPRQADVFAYGRVHREVGANPLTSEEELIRAASMLDEVHASAFDGLLAALRSLGLQSARIGIDESRCFDGEVDRLQQALPNAKITRAGLVLQTIRMVKTPAEIELLRTSTAITCRAIADTFRSVGDSVSESDLAISFRTSVAQQGGVPTSWLISIGRRTGRTHTRQSSDYAVSAGDAVKVDAGATYSSYWSDVARTKVFGGAPKRLSHAYEALCEAVQKGASHVRAGVRSSTIHEVVVEAVRQRGYPTYQRHMVGHGIGITSYDPPILRAAGENNFFGIADVDPVLESGMVINVETPYYQLGEFGLIVEDTLLVTPTGAELLSPLSYAIEL